VEHKLVKLVPKGQYVSKIFKVVSSFLWLEYHFSSRLDSVAGVCGAAPWPGFRRGLSLAPKAGLSAKLWSDVALAKRAERREIKPYDIQLWIDFHFFKLMIWTHEPHSDGSPANHAAVPNALRRRFHCPFFSTSEEVPGSRVLRVWEPRNPWQTRLLISIDQACKMM